ncbi:MAG: hypothetical protein KBF62_00215 [Candidatus Pacebacteria bacterium]|mgnify:FL=1|jgi:hypothetical protein|nr:hypothetical protein [Candidatus Paceibacterota bacterium]MBP9058055.1 hypothetical protein [Candidatus Paceibacterota bacterium]MBP9770040.1 hypothetical protein [Candidatus Paceibacterota bacterium]
MLINTWGEVFSASLQNLWWGFVNFVPNLIVAVIIFVIGWAIGGIVARAVEQVLGALKIDRVLKSAGVEEVVEKAGMKLNFGRFIGMIVKWFLIVVFLMTSLEIIGLSDVNTFLREVVLNYLPRVIIAAFVLVIASVVASAIQKVVEGGARAANIHTAKMLSTIAKYAVWIFAFIIALSQLGVAPQFMQILFTGIIAMISIGGGLAFGLGGKEAASRFLDKVRSESN